MSVSFFLQVWLLRLVCIGVFGACNFAVQKYVHFSNWPIIFFLWCCTASLTLGHATASHSQATHRETEAILGLKHLHAPVGTAANRQHGGRKFHPTKPARQSPSEQLRQTRLAGISVAHGIHGDHTRHASRTHPACIADTRGMHSRPSSV